MNHSAWERCETCSVFFKNKNSVVGTFSLLQQLVCAACALVMVGTELKAEDTFEPYASSDVPTAVALWEEYDPRKEPLDIEIVQE